MTKFVDVTAKNRQVVGLWEGEEGKTLHNLQVLGMNEDLWDRIHGLGSKA